jgi:cyclophilin family peptidyl-prolyl cis-trans isomerase/HEAT repeat protein
LEARALQLLLVDRQIYEPYTVERSMLGGPDLRLDLARALGRISDPRAVSPLEGLLQDDSPEVRRAAAFALGEHAAETNLLPLLDAAGDADRETGRLAVEALAKWKAPIQEVENALVGLPEEEAWSRLLPSLFLFDETRAVSLAIQGLEKGEALHRLAAFGLCRNPRPEGLPAIRKLALDPSPEIRAWSARALGRVGERHDLGILKPLLNDGSPGPVVQALRAGKGLVESHGLAAPEEWRGRLIELLDDPTTGVRATALEVAGAWLLDPPLSARLVERARSGPERERELALLALSEGGDPAGLELVGTFARSPSAVLRSAAAIGAAKLGDFETLGRLAGDESPRVRVAALEASLEGDSDEDGAVRVRLAFADPDPIVRAVALSWLKDHPVIPFEPIVLALRGAWNEREPDARLAAVDALESRARASEDELDAITLALLELADSPEYLLRRQVVQALLALGQDAPPVGAVSSRLGTTEYRTIWLASREPWHAELVTDHGTLQLEIDCPSAPQTCLNFIQLAGQGFYDGLIFHRVVPDFVVQAGDPRGDGWGGPGYSIRDEINPLRFDRGVLGMALSGPHTGGSQFFVALADQPHLDGGYTAFGRVAEGLDILDQIVQGDRIVGLRPLESNLPRFVMPTTPRSGAE